MTTTSIWRTSRTGPSMDSADCRPSEMTRIVRGVAGATIRTSSLWARVSRRTSRSAPATAAWWTTSVTVSGTVRPDASA